MSIICADTQFRNLMSEFKQAVEERRPSDDVQKIAVATIETLASHSSLSPQMKRDLDGSILKQMYSLVSYASAEGIEGGPATDLIFDLAPYVPHKDHPKYDRFELSSFEQYLTYKIALQIKEQDTLQNYQAIFTRQSNRTSPANSTPHTAPQPPR